MSNGKYSKRRGVSTKAMSLILAVVLIVGLTVGGTLAWLTDTTSEVENTFTVGNIDIELAESVDTDQDGKASFKIIPGSSETKDPKVTVKANSEACYVFVTVTEVNNVAVAAIGDKAAVPYVTYSIDSGWTELTSAASGNTKVYYRTQNATTSDVPYSVLTGDSVSYSTDLTKTEIDKLYNNDGTVNTGVLPKLTFKAYAVQQSNGTATFTVEQAWDIAQDGTLNEA